LSELNETQLKQLVMTLASRARAKRQAGPCSGAAPIVASDRKARATVAAPEPVLVGAEGDPF
jgi:hypothetical protein